MVTYIFFLLFFFFPFSFLHTSTWFGWGYVNNIEGRFKKMFGKGIIFKRNDYNNTIQIVNVVKCMPLVGVVLMEQRNYFTLCCSIYRTVLFLSLSLQYIFVPYLIFLSVDDMMKIRSKGKSLFFLIKKKVSSTPEQSAFI